MSSPGQLDQVNEFRGKSGAECESFIKSIRKASWKEGKLDDARWMAHFASLHYSGNALKWHSALSVDVRQDWFKQEMALLERWPPPADGSDNEDAEAAIVPTPAAASLLSLKAGRSSDIGVMQFVPMSMAPGEEYTYIAEPGITGECTLTTKVEKALRLRCDRSVDSGARVLEWVGSGSKWLAIHWLPENPSFTSGSTIWARLTVVGLDTLTPATLRDACIPTRGPFRVNTWKISSEGETTLVWKDGHREIQLEIFKDKDYMCIAVDPVAYQQENLDDRRGRLVFQPV